MREAGVHKAAVSCRQLWPCGQENDIQRMWSQLPLFTEDLLCASAVPSALHISHKVDNISLLRDKETHAQTVK